MRGTPCLWRRTRRLEATLIRVDAQAEVARLAADLGIPAAQLWTEAATLVARYSQGRRCNVRAMVDAIARERGLDPAEVWAEVQRLLAGGRRCA